LTDASPQSAAAASMFGADAQWVAVESHIVDALLGHDAALEHALQTSEEADLPPIAVSPNQGKLLYLLARLVGARAVLELGTLGAYSTIWMARALPAEGRLITIEANPAYAEVAAANIAAAAVGEVVELRVGDALEELADLQAQRSGPFDLLFIDADKQRIPEYFEAALSLSRRGSLIVVDNIVRRAAIVDEGSEDPGVLGIRRFYELAAAEPRVSATAIQTVGSKGYDGFAIALVES
jgi:predicted O-methyltransferase YrrM